jgi:microcystin degradation protein MlrC
MRQRGIEAANLLVDHLKGKTNPVQVLVQVPLAISIEQQLTANEPCNAKMPNFMLNTRLSTRQTQWY